MPEYLYMDLIQHYADLMSFHVSVKAVLLFAL